MTNNLNMNKGNKKAKVTDETKAESSKLKTLWDNRAKRISQVEFGEKYGVGSQGAMTQFLNGITPISMKAAIGFAKGLGCQISDFSIRLAKEAEEYGNAVKAEATDDYASISVLNVEVSAGGGAQGVDLVEAKGELHFKRTFLSEIGVNKNNAAIVRVRGQSMEPTIFDGAIILINMQDTSLRSGSICAFVHGDLLLVKRFFFEGGAWIARSDNIDKRKFKDIRIDGSNPCRILGRAVWVGMML